MEPSPLIQWLRGVPFIPFTVTLSSGRTVQITGPEMVIPGRRWDTAAFVDEDGFDRIVVLMHDHIASIDAYDPVQSRKLPE